jgi:hypothetical protein
LYRVSDETTMTTSFMLIASTEKSIYYFDLARKHYQRLPKPGHCEDNPVSHLTYFTSHPFKKVEIHHLGCTFCTYCHVHFWAPDSSGGTYTSPIIKCYTTLPSDYFIKAMIEGA